MYIYKSIEYGDTSLQKVELNNKVLLNSGSDGLNVIHFRKLTKNKYGDITTGSNNISGSYWQSLQLNFYLSGSYGAGYNTPSESKYKNPIYSFAEYYSKHPQHLWKFHDSGSTISISQKLFGEEIKRESFKLVDNSTSETVTIKDDGFGNLYATTPSITQSNTPFSSSDNYVGNIFYRNGVVSITETGSYSSSISYKDVTTDSFTLEFESTQTIYTKEYTVIINPGEFNSTNNVTTRALRSGSISLDGNKLTQTPLFKNKLTGSGWNPHFNTIGFYDNDDKCVMVARYSQNIQIPKKFPITCKVRLDI